ncbi:hypothetical protein P278_24570 [Zhouia amylolytica AD3]|uniref:Uncharacterized protein n=1 Tax=Zhouia amylolytica AD3 TaxID=1286632 RepID=W2UKI9_9FLAO|nr:hypothetical protein P278_24570 [Zhouia amylolytica AD3]
MLNNLKTLETFFVFKVSMSKFALNYERKNYREGIRHVFNCRF